MTEAELAEAEATYQAAMIAEIEETGELAYAPPFAAWCAERYGGDRGSTD